MTPHVLLDMSMSPLWVVRLVAHGCGAMQGQTLVNPPFGTWRASMSSLGGLGPGRDAGKD